MVGMHEREAWSEDDVVAGKLLAQRARQLAGRRSFLVAVIRKVEPHGSHAERAACPDVLATARSGGGARRGEAHRAVTGVRRRLRGRIAGAHRDDRHARASSSGCTHRRSHR
jgi:hypothetical protein